MDLLEHQPAQRDQRDLHAARRGLCLGIAVHGFCRLHIASLSKKYEPRVTGILGFGAGCASTILFSPAFTARGLVYDHTVSSSSPCYTSGSPTSTHPTQTQQSDYRDRSIYRVISGVNDEIFGHQQQWRPHGVQLRL